MWLSALASASIEQDELTDAVPFSWRQKKSESFFIEQHMNPKFRSMSEQQSSAPEHQQWSLHAS